jgi:sulfide:quinone oxidoreductase
MRKILILGAGAGGTIVANMLRKELMESEWQITIIDRDERHHYQAGYLFIPFGVYSEQDVLKPKKEFIPQGVEFVVDKVMKIDPAQRRVETLKGQYEYDWLVIATGCDIQPSEINGMLDGWRKDIFDFYTLEGALALRKQLKYFNSGKIVLNIAEFPYKCPIAPLEFVFMADWFFTVNGVRDKVEIEFVTPLDNVFTKPVAAKALASVAAKKNIKVTPYFDLAQVNAGEKTIESHKGQKVGYDLLVAIPPNMGAKALIDSGVSDPVGFVPTDKHTLKASKLDRVYVIGDTTNVPTSKAGSWPITGPIPSSKIWCAKSTATQRCPNSTAMPPVFWPRVLKRRFCLISTMRSSRCRDISRSPAWAPSACCRKVSATIGAK